MSNSTPITPSVKRNRDELSPGYSIPPFKVIRRSPKERRDEITDIVEQYINPMQRELDATNRELIEMRVELKELRESKSSKTGISNTELDSVKLELKVRTKELERFQTELAELKGIKSELKRVCEENTKLGEQCKKQERFNRRSNVRMKGFAENKWESNADCRKKVLDMLQHAGIPLPPLAIELAHRVGVKQKYSDRAILVTTWETEKMYW